MRVTEALEFRFTARHYRPDPVPKQILTEVVKAAIHAPSWANTQPWEVFAATGEPLERLRQSFLANFRSDVPPRPDLPAPPEWPPALKQRTQELGAKRLGFLGIARDNKEARRASWEANYRFFNAPMVLYLCMDRTLTSWSVFDMGLFAQSIMLAAQDHGLNSAVAYLLAAYPELIRSELGIPDELMVLIGIALGYADVEHPENQFRSERRTLDEVVRLVGFC